MGSNFTLIPISEASKPFDGVAHIYIDHWWIIQDECILVYTGRSAKRDLYSPQCNRYKEIVERLLSRYPGCEIRQLPVVFIKHKCD